MANGSQNQNNVICGSCPPCEKEKKDSSKTEKKPPHKCCIQLKYFIWGLFAIAALAVFLYVGSKCFAILDIRLARQLGI